MSNTDEYIFIKEIKELESYIDFCKIHNPCFAKELEMYSYCLLTYTDLRTEDYFYRIIQRINKFILDIVTYNTQWCSKQGYEPKTFQIICKYGDEIKVISMKNAPVKGIKRDTKTFKSYDMKLFNSISRARQAICELAKCNDWQYFVTFTINKKQFDRYILKEYITAFTKWLSNYSARKTGGIKIDYLLIPELHKDGAWHLHGLMNGIPGKHLSSFEKGKHPRYLIENGYLNWAAYEKKFGFCSFDKIRSKQKVAGYITKFIRQPSRVQKIMKLNSKLYYNTKGLLRSTEMGRGYNILDIDDPDFENEWVSIKWL